MEVWYWECRLTAFLPEFTLFKPFLLFVIFQNVLANTAFNNQGIIFILQIYADQKIFNCETFIEMSVWERGKRALGGRDSERAGSGKARGRLASESSALIRIIYLLIFQLVQLLLFGKIWICVLIVRKEQGSWRPFGAEWKFLVSWALPAMAG